MSHPAPVTEESSQATLNTVPLPNGWRWMRLGELCLGSGQYGTSEKANATQSTGIPVLGMSNIFEGRLRWDNLRFINLPPAELDKYRLRKGDVLFNRTNSAELVGKTAVFDGLRDAIFASYLIRLRVNEAIANPDFIAAYINSEGGRRFIEANMARAIGQVNISASTIMTMLVPVAPLAEQQRISAILQEHLTSIERAHAAAEMQLKAAKSLYTSYLRSVFDSEEARQWDKKRLGDIAIVGPDNGAFKKRHEFGKGVPIVNVLDLYRSLKLDLSKVERVNASLNEQKRYAIASGDLFFCRSSLKREGVGWCCYVEEVNEPAIFECHVMRVRLEPDKALPDFVAHYWRHPAVREEVISSAKTATMTTMNQGDLARVIIPLPTINEQRRLATDLSEKLEKTDRIVSFIQTQLNEINKLPAALLRQAFSGKL